MRKRMSARTQDRVWRAVAPPTGTRKPVPSTVQPLTLPMSARQAARMAEREAQRAAVRAAMAEETGESRDAAEKGRNNADL